MMNVSRKLLLLLSVSFTFSVFNTQAIETKMITTKKIQEKPTKLELFEQKIAEKMVLDIRYFCDEDSEILTGKNCRQAVTTLPVQLSQMITETNIGGIVLFAENVIETTQVVQLTHDIQTAALKSASAKPIIIAIDQEGGRVARFAKMTGFSGNMAIGATYKKHDIYFSEQVNTVLGKELKALGINNNYAPVVDVNTNASNPVINTRSYGENAQQVAKLGVAALDALQVQGVMATLKHFPGHGDTHVDSHIGLPSVDHDIVTIEEIDLAPFTLAIDKTDPAMIMTAHIQYPVLDNSTFTAKSGEKLIRPATMSKKILTDLLRNKMAFNGIIATDALDMAGISHYFTEVEAVVETFIAGADLAVMPFKIRNPSDILEFHLFIKEVAQALSARITPTDASLHGGYSLAEFEQSLVRLQRYKKRYITLDNKTLTEKITDAQTVVAKAEHLVIEQNLANAAVTVLQGDIAKLYSNIINKKSFDQFIKHVHLVVANQQEFLALNRALRDALKQVFTSKQSMPTISYFIADSDFNELANEVAMKKADLLIATIDVKTASLVDIGGMDDLASVKTRIYGSEAVKQKKHSYAQALKDKLESAKKQQVTSVLIAKGSPYLLGDYRNLVDVILLNFDDRIYSLATNTNTSTNSENERDSVTLDQQNETQLNSPGFNASIAAVFLSQPVHGRLPVSLKVK